MARYAFKLRIRPDAVEEYDREHQRVWPELLAKLKEVGISDYSIFRRGQELVLCLRVEDFDKAWDELDRDPVNRRWQEFMSRLFEPVPGKGPEERFAMMKGSFLPGVRDGQLVRLTRPGQILALSLRRKSIARARGFHLFVTVNT